MEAQQLIDESHRRRRWPSSNPSAATAAEIKQAQPKPDELILPLPKPLMRLLMMKSQKPSKAMMESIITSADFEDRSPQRDEASWV